MPQAVLQGYAYLQTAAPSALQRVSLLGSLLAAGPSPPTTMLQTQSIFIFSCNANGVP